ncbi:YagK/YfjJ domain-containing protein [Vibrio campbellii]|uniref:YagK/YfjJ domain-containing protein n=1 Tax=Vibrio campbellii TaxID=680 RepID=UPI00142E6939|nr:inovirus-type Gp2 protein [Vibrio campbellii]NIY88512.1 inovirus Gp2 family protein [Vibrio campbellii]NVK69424.1 inovirus-type Gp2 protein [Vibrio campbellii]
MKKHQSCSPYFRYEGKVYEINARKGMPIFTHQLRKSIDQLTAMEGYHHRVLVVVFGLHLPSYSKGNEMISKFLSWLRYWLVKEYKINRIGYVWCRERNKANAQHYHFALMLDGSKLQYPSKFLNIAKENWHRLSAGGFLFIPDNCFYMLKRGNAIVRAAIIYRLSYYAKVNSKQTREGMTNDYGTSRLSRPPL